jgi:hypothetical protein
MNVTPTNQTQKKAGYLLLTSATYHANNHDTTTLLLGLRSVIAEEMLLETLLESTALIELLIWPRFYF